MHNYPAGIFRAVGRVEKNDRQKLEPGDRKMLQSQHERTETRVKVATWRF